MRGIHEVFNALYLIDLQYLKRSYLGGKGNRISVIRLMGGYLLTLRDRSSNTGTACSSVDSHE